MESSVTRPAVDIATDRPRPGLGLRARRAGAGKGRSTAAVIVAALCIAQMAVWTAVSVLS